MKATIFMLIQLFSLAPRFGGEHYSIYINNTLMTQQIIAHQDKVPTIFLTPDLTGSMAIHYDHCGQLGKSRSLSVLNEKNETVKNWVFDDSLNTRDRMTVDAKSIAQLIKLKGELQLVYSSKELPKGRVLAKVVLETQKQISKTE